jgi:hypothetical protein
VFGRARPEDMQLGRIFGRDVSQLFFFEDGERNKIHRLLNALRLTFGHS